MRQWLGLLGVWCCRCRLGVLGDLRLGGFSSGVVVGSRCVGIGSLRIVGRVRMWG